VHAAQAVEAMEDTDSLVQSLVVLPVEQAGYLTRQCIRFT